MHRGPLGPSRVWVLAWLCSVQAAPHRWHEGAAHQVWQRRAGHLAATRQSSTAVICGQCVLGTLPAQAEQRLRLADERENRKPQVRQGRERPAAHSEFCARAAGTDPPVPQTVPVPVGLSPTLTPQGCCLLWPQPHVWSLCWVRSVTARGWVVHTGSLLCTHSWP